MLRALLGSRGSDSSKNQRDGGALKTHRALKGERSSEAGGEGAAGEHTQGCWDGLPCAAHLPAPTAEHLAWDKEDAQCIFLAESNKHMPLGPDA